MKKKTKKKNTMSKETEYNFKKFDPSTFRYSFHGVSLLGSGYVSFGKSFWEMIVKRVKKEPEKFEIQYDEKKKAIWLAPATTGWKITRQRTKQVLTCRSLLKFLPRGRYLFVEEMNGGFVCQMKTMSREKELN